MAGEISTRNVSKFDSKNFQAWKLQLQAIFVAKQKRAAKRRWKSRKKTWIKNNEKAMSIWTLRGYVFDRTALKINSRVFSSLRRLSYDLINNFSSSALLGTLKSYANQHHHSLCINALMNPLS